MLSIQLLGVGILPVHELLQVVLQLLLLLFHLAIAQCPLGEVRFLHHGLISLLSRTSRSRTSHVRPLHGALTSAFHHAALGALHGFVQGDEV